MKRLLSGVLSAMISVACVAAPVSVLAVDETEQTEVSVTESLVKSIDALDASMMESDDVSSTFQQASALKEQYDALSDPEKEQITNIDALNDLLDGNSEALDVANVNEEESSLSGKTIGYLGSSITYGFRSDGVSFADYIEKMTGSTSVKQAVTGGPLAKKDGVRDEISYITQLLEGELQECDSLDALVVQLSTNDTTLGIEIGEVSDSNELEDFDYSTVIGAMEYIIAYAEEKWDCPVMFYINPYLSDEAIESFCTENDMSADEVKQAYQTVYQEMIDALYQVQDKWDIGVIDMWNEESFRNVSVDLREYYMADIIHPTKAGYLFWYAPYMIEQMETYFSEVNGEHTVDLKQESETVYSYDAASEGCTSRFSSVLTPAYYVYAGNMNEDEAETLLDELGIADHLHEWGASVKVITPIEEEYGEADAEAFITLLGASVSNAKVIGIDEGATFVNNYISQECYAVAGIMTVGGEMNEGLDYDAAVPAYLSDASDTALNYYISANDAEKVSETTYENSTDPLQRVVTGNDETLREAFQNAWENVFSKNYRQHNETTEFYMTSAATHTDPYLLIGIPDYEELGMNYIEHYNETIEGVEGEYTWFEYVPDSTYSAVNGTMPLVVSLHGNGNDPRIQGDTTGWVELASKENFIVVSPEWQDTVLDSSTHEPIDNYFACNGVEVCFEEWMETVLKAYPQIDRTRIYVTGLSAGGSASALYGVKYSDYFAAVGAVSAPGLDTAEVSELVKNAEHETAFMYMCGDHDFFGMIPVDGSSTNSFEVADGVYLQQVDTNTTMFPFIQSYQKLNGVTVSDSYDMSLNAYYGVKLENEQWIKLGVKDTLEGTLSNDTGVIMKLAAIKDQAHWNYKPEAEYMWDFFQHYSRIDGVLYIDGVSTESKSAAVETDTKKEETKQTETKKTESVDTSDASDVFGYAIVCTMAMIAGVSTIVYRKKHEA